MQKRSQTTGKVQPDDGGYSCLRAFARPLREEIARHVRAECSYIGLECSAMVLAERGLTFREVEKILLQLFGDRSDLSALQIEDAALRRTESIREKYRSRRPIKRHSSDPMLAQIERLEADLRRATKLRNR